MNFFKTNVHVKFTLIQNRALESSSNSGGDERGSSWGVDAISSGGENQYISRSHGNGQLTDAAPKSGRHANRCRRRHGMSHRYFPKRLPEQPGHRPDHPITVGSISAFPTPERAYKNDCSFDTRQNTRREHLRRIVDKLPALAVTGCNKRRLDECQRLISRKGQFNLHWGTSSQRWSAG